MDDVKILVPVTKTRYGVIEINLSKEEADRILGEDVSYLRQAATIERMARKKLKAGDPIIWKDGDEAGISGIKIQPGFFVEGETNDEECG